MKKSIYKELATNLFSLEFFYISNYKVNTFSFSNEVVNYMLKAGKLTKMTFISDEKKRLIIRIENEFFIPKPCICIVNLKLI